MSVRHSIVRSDIVEYSAWLTFDEDGTLSLTRSRPGLRPHQRAAELTLIVPRALFKTPELRVAITVRDPGTPSLDIQVAAETVADAIARGCDLKVIVQAAGDA